MDGGAWWVYSPWGSKELDMTEQLTHTKTYRTHSCLGQEAADEVKQEMNQKVWEGGG